MTPPTYTPPRTTRCADCKHPIPAHTEAAKVNNRIVCKGCAEHYEPTVWGWVLKREGATK